MILLAIEKFFQTSSSFLKKFWQPIAGAFVVIATLIYKKVYDSKIKKETTKEIETQATVEAAAKQGVLDGASIQTLVSHAADPLPASWNDLECMSKEGSGNVDPNKKKRILRKLQRKD